MSEEDEARIAAAIMAQDLSHTRGWYRINAIRNLSGGAKLTPPVNDKQAEVNCLSGRYIESFHNGQRQTGSGKLFVWKIFRVYSRRSTTNRLR